MKVGDLVRLKNLGEEWGEVGLITRIHITDIGTGQIYLIVGDCPRCTIPWLRRHEFMETISHPSAVPQKKSRERDSYSVRETMR